MKLTDLFIKKPVLSTVISLIILFLGLRSVFKMNIREFPKTENTVITVTTVYVGASAELVKGFITTPLEQSIASAEGIDYMVASSSKGVSRIQVFMKLNYDPNAALTEVTSKVAAVRNILPRESQSPVISKSTGRNVPYMFLSFYSKKMTRAQITEFLRRVVQPKLQSIDGVAKASIFGNKNFSMRIWLNPVKLAEYHMTPVDVYKALASNNYLSSIGHTKGKYIQINLAASTDIHSVEAFKNIVIKTIHGVPVKIGDVATVALGAENYSTAATYNSQNAIAMAIYTTPAANPLTVIKDVKAELPSIKKQLPPFLNMSVIYDGTLYIRDSIYEVIKTMAEALVIVVLVIFLFLGSYRSVLVPIVAIPLSIVGGLFMMWIMNYSINLLTLLAMVLAIGLVVDDAIVVVENVSRHIESGKSPFEAAIIGARELVNPIIAMSITLVAVFLPIGFMGGLTGALFKEFAFTLAGDVVISGVIALTLSPMLSSKLLRTDVKKGFGLLLDRLFSAVRERYVKLLRVVLDSTPIVIFVVVVVSVSAYFLYSTSRQELAPTEDQGAIFVMGKGAPDATLNQLLFYGGEMNKIYRSFPEAKAYFEILGFESNNGIFSGLILKPWSERKRSEMKILPLLQRKLNTITGIKAVAFPLPSLPGSRGLPVQFIVESTKGYRQIYQVANELVRAAKKSGLFLYVDSDLKFNTPEVRLIINRKKAHELGMTMQDISNDLSVLLGGNYVNRFSYKGYSYKVIPQVMDRYRAYPSMLNDYYIRTASGRLVPLSSVVSMKKVVLPRSLNQFQQLNCATIEGVMTPGVSLGEALSFLEREARKILPKGFTYSFSGMSRQFVKEGSSMLITFVFALIIIYLVLAALFESFRDPFVVLISAPLSVTGALIFISMGLASINIYTMVGLVTLIGLISKHGILIVRFANDLQMEGLGKREAVEQASAIRLRPILMTTAAMILGVVPLLFATGPGAVSRFDIGLVITAGLGIGTLFTIFVVPSMYMLIARDFRGGGSK